MPPKVHSVYPRCAVVSSMITLCVKKIDDSWFGLAYAGEGIVATTIDSVKERAVRSLVKSSPSNVERRIAEDVSEFAERTLLMMKELESGREEHKRFSLADEYFPAPILKVLQMAAAIPIGCVTSYGNIAKLAGTDPRVVGQIMANNPLYPIVPCHRVVGSDFSLVGYGGRKSHHALQAKLTRLSREAKGFTTRTEIPVNGKSLTVYPVEHVIQKAAQHQLKASQQRRLFEH